MTDDPRKSARVPAGNGERGGRFAAKAHPEPDFELQPVSDAERTAALVDDIERLARSAHRIVSRGRMMFDDANDDTQYLAAKALVIDTATAVKELPESFTQQRPEIPWSSIAGVRNRLAHTYRAISRDALLETLTVSVPRPRSSRLAAGALASIHR